MNDDQGPWGPRGFWTTIWADRYLWTMTIAALALALALAGCAQHSALLTPWQAYMVRHGGDPNGISAAETEALKSPHVHCRTTVFSSRHFATADTYCH